MLAQAPNMTMRFLSNRSGRMTTDITKEELWGLCKAGQGSACCRYIVMDPKTGFRCAKHEPTLAAQINFRVLLETFTAVGDNCEGKRP